MMSRCPNKTVTVPGETTVVHSVSRASDPHKGSVQVLHNLLFTPSESPNNNWGANWPGGLTDPSCPGEEKRERERERERAWVRFFVRPWPVGFVVLGALRLNLNTCRGEFLTGRSERHFEGH